MLWAAGVGVALSEHLAPAVLAAACKQLVELFSVCAHCQMIEASPTPVMFAADIRELLEEDVHAALVAPHAAFGPVGVALALPAELTEQPVEGAGGSREVPGPQLDVMHCVLHATYVRSTTVTPWSGM